LRTTTDGGRRDAGFGGDRLAGQALAVQRLDAVDRDLGGGWRSRLGRELRFWRLARPSALKRSTHFCTV
jgi:hypothetical protein